MTCPFIVIQCITPVFHKGSSYRNKYTFRNKIKSHSITCQQDTEEEKEEEEEEEEKEEEYYNLYPFFILGAKCF